MNRRSLLQVLGVSMLALLGSCLGRTDAAGEYPSLLALVLGDVERPTSAADGGTNPDDAGSSGGSDGGGLGGGSADEGADESDGESPDTIGFDVDGAVADLESEGIENGSATYATGTLTVSFDSSAANAPEAEAELRTVLAAADDAITDPDAFGSAVEALVVRFRRPDGSKARPVPVDPEWALAYRAGDISMGTYLERVREGKR